MLHAVPDYRSECDLNEFYAVFMKFMQSHTLCRVCLLQEDDPEFKPNHPHPVIAAFIQPICRLQPCMTGHIRRCALRHMNGLVWAQLSGARLEAKQGELR